tara:strand:+ start:7691 stop:10105 length:2415 start_codon:yes stop_codon:yes gene_type:complete
MFIVNPDVAVTEVGKGRALAYIKGSESAITLSQVEYWLFLEVDANAFTSPEALAIKTESSLSSIFEAISRLKDEKIIFDSIVESRAKSKLSFLERVDKYSFKVGYANSLPLISWYINSLNWRILGLKFFPYLIIISLVATYGFYFSSVRPLGKIIIDDFFYAPSIYEAFLIFTITNFLAAIYKIAVGAGTKYGTKTLYLKLLAGFNPVFDTDEDVGYTKPLKCSRKEYLYYVASPTILRIYILLLCIALVYIMYPFSGSISSRLLSILFTTINISWMAFFWQLIPSPGTLSVKFLEIYGIIPFKYLGPSVKRVVLLFAGKNVDQDKRETLKSAVYLLMTVFLIFFKVVFLGFWVLPQISIGIPHFLGQWTSQIVILVLGFLSFRYLTHTVRPKGASNQDVGKVVGQQLNQSIDRFLNKLGPKKRIALIVAAVMLFPFGSSISGVARVQENMSLQINSSESEISYVRTIFKKGPSAVPVSKGETILELTSEGLELRLKQLNENLVALEQDELILTNERDALLEGGSIYENSKNKTEDVLISASSVRALTSEKQSLQRQLAILKSQAETYELLATQGIVSRIQYQDKLLEYEIAKVNYSDAANSLESALATGRKALRDEKVEQTLKIGEELKSKTSELRQVRASIAKENAELIDTEARIKNLTVKAPFDCVVASDTSLLEGKAIGLGDEIISIKAVPTQRITVSIPEYDRNEIALGDPVEIRLYSKIFSKNTGYLYGNIDAVSPASEIDKDQEQIEVNVLVNESLSDSMIGATGVGKIRSGYTCLLVNLIKPLARFVEVDMWQYVP